MLLEVRIVLKPNLLLTRLGLIMNSSGRRNILLAQVGQSGLSCIACTLSHRHALTEARSPCEAAGAGYTTRPKASFKQLVWKICVCVRACARARARVHVRRHVHVPVCVLYVCVCVCVRACMHACVRA